LTLQSSGHGLIVTTSFEKACIFFKDCVFFKALYIFLVILVMVGILFNITATWEGAAMYIAELYQALITWGM